MLWNIPMTHLRTLLNNPKNGFHFLHVFPHFSARAITVQCLYSDFSISLLNRSHACTHTILVLCKLAIYKLHHNSVAVVFVVTEACMWYCWGALHLHLVVFIYREQLKARCRTFAVYMHFCSCMDVELLRVPS